MNNLQAVKLKVNSITVAEVDYNKEELKAWVNESIKMYSNIVVTEENVKSAKKMCAELNSAEKDLSKFRISTKKEASKNLKPFEDGIKEMCSDIIATKEKILEQVNVFVEAEKKKKYELAILLIGQTQNEIPLWDKYLEQIVVEEKWTNATTNPTAMKKMIVARFEEVKLLQDQEQNKIDTVKAILEVYNEKLKFKFEFDDFNQYMELGVSELKEKVKSKVDRRMEAEKAEVERAEREKQEAIEQAKKEAEEKAQKEADRVAAEVERKRLEEEQRVEDEKYSLKLEAENNLIKEKSKLNHVIEAVTKDVESIIPVEIEEKEGLKEEFIDLRVYGTSEQLNTLKAYLDLYFKYTELF